MLPILHREGDHSNSVMCKSTKLVIAPMILLSQTVDPSTSYEGCKTTASQYTWAFIVKALLLNAGPSVEPDAVTHFCFSFPISPFLVPGFTSSHGNYCMHLGLHPPRHKISGSSWQ